MRKSQQSFGDLLKLRRKSLRFSQLNLALEANISQRHISFLEQGRAKPSQTMVRKIAHVLKLDYQGSNLLMVAAGFAPTYQTLLDEKEQAEIDEMTHFMLNQHMPYPAMLVDESWNIKASNQSSVRLFSWLLRMTPSQMFDASHAQPNLLTLILGNLTLIATVENWPQVAQFMVKRALDEGLLTQPQIIQMLNALPDDYQKRYKKYDNTLTTPAILPIIYKKGDIRLSLTSLQSKFMMSQNIAVNQLSIEYFIPNDDVTKLFFKNF